MSVVIITPPDTVDLLTAAKAKIIVEHDDDDDYLTSLVNTALAMVDGPFGRLGRCIRQQTLEASFDGFGCRPLLWLPYPPFISLVSVTYDDADGVETSLSTAVCGLKQDRGLYRKDGQGWPTTRRGGYDTVRVRYTAGYSDGLPAPVQEAVLGLVAQWYAVREPVTDKPLHEVPFTVSDLLAPFVMPVV